MVNGTLGEASSTKQQKAGAHEAPNQMQLPPAPQNRKIQRAGHVHGNGTRPIKVGATRMQRVIDDALVGRRPNNHDMALFFTRATARAASGATL